MIGYRTSNNNLYVFLEENDGLDLEKKCVEGLFLYPERELLIPCRLEINQSMNNLVQVNIPSDGNGMVRIYIHRHIFNAFNEKKSVETHEGWMHLFLKDSKHLNGFMDTLNYQALCSLRGEYDPRN